jgi:hypothetical protein
LRKNTYFFLIYSWAWICCFKISCFQIYCLVSNSCFKISCFIIYCLTWINCFQIACRARIRWFKISYWAWIYLFKNYDSDEFLVSKSTAEHESLASKSLA